MRVIFERVDERRYRIGVMRDGRHDVGADVPVRGAPGRADVPHDLVHFVVEEQAGLALGIYGQVAAGGDCGGFFARDGRLDPSLRAAINQRLGEVLDRWRRTPPGGRLVLTWPDTLTIRNGRIPARSTVGRPTDGERRTRNGMRRPS